MKLVGATEDIMSTVAVQAHQVTWLKRSLPWAGWLLSAGSMSILLMSARWKLTFDPWYVQEWGRIGWATDALPRIALIQLACVALYLTPRTAVLGAVLLTGYLGGAISQYVRIGEPIPPLVPLTTALLAWAGLYLREERLRALLPFRRKRRN